jgi:hypothetical protein
MFNPARRRNISVADTDAQLLRKRRASRSTTTQTRKSTKTIWIWICPPERSINRTIPVRLYLREMGVVPLLTRQGEVTIAQRIERGQIKTRKAISRSPIAVERLLQIGDELESGKGYIRETVTFSEQRVDRRRDKAEEYLRWTLEESAIFV